MDNDCKERREAELEFVASAYSTKEAWCEINSDDHDVIVRRLSLPSSKEDVPYNNNTSNPVEICLRLTLPYDYPTVSPLVVDATTLDSNNQLLLKAALNSLPHLVSSCQKVAMENQGEEAVFLVFNQAEEWIQDEWPNYLQKVDPQTPAASNGTKEATSSSSSFSAHSSENNNNFTNLLGRRLIYSHHIISKTKRANIRSLASDYHLNGYMKIGWPGILIIEGREEDCIAFYDDIRPWAWQYLVVRGEQQEYIGKNQSLDTQRKFQEFVEVDDMSMVARHCREVGLEALFKTSMKVYDNNNSTDIEEGEEQGLNGSHYSCYGAMIHVDHMNNPKGYRKWIRKAAQETDCRVVIKQSYKNQDYSSRPKIVVGAIGNDRESVSLLLKRWRTSRVDVDSKGKPCYERQMTVVVEGLLETANNIISNDLIDWDEAISDENVTIPEERLMKLMESIGGLEWKEAFARI